MQVRTTVLILGMALGAHAALAHDYDPNKPITLTGTVKEIKWQTPYVKIHLSVKDAKGKTKDWELETATPSVLESSGLVRTSLKKDDRITVQGEQASNGSEHVLVRSMTLAGGRAVSISDAQVATAPTPAPLAPEVSKSSTPRDADSAALPRTATNTPLIALIGLCALGAGTFLALLRTRLS